MHNDGASVFSKMSTSDHEQVVFCRDDASGLRAIIAIHNTELGPALGGCRMYPYASDQDALTDVLRLAQGMTLKAALSGLDLGGGKAVIIGDPKRDKKEVLFRSLGRFIDGLAGRYITAEDAGTTLADIEKVRLETRHVVGVSKALGGSGDPSPVTALGVFSGMRAAIEQATGLKDDLKGLRVAVQGCGNVGRHVVEHLVRARAHVIVCDVDDEAARKLVTRLGVEQVAPQDITHVECDVFAPCAMGGVLNKDSIAALRCQVVAGAANNQLANEALDGPRLAARGIIYAPDFAINAGGLINVANEMVGYDSERAHNQAQGIYEVMHAIFKRARDEGILTYQAANLLAHERILAMRSMRRLHNGRAQKRS